MMSNFFKSYTFIISFLISCIFMEMLLGKDFLNKFLWIVLFGLVITNSDEFVKKIGSFKIENQKKEKSGKY